MVKKDRPIDSIQIIYLPPICMPHGFTIMHSICKRIDCSSPSVNAFSGASFVHSWTNRDAFRNASSMHAAEISFFYSYIFYLSVKSNAFYF